MKVSEDDQRAKSVELGIPYWRDEAPYPSTGGQLSYGQWSWQFFRRNWAYREFYRCRLGPYFEGKTDDDPLDDLYKFGVMMSDDPVKMDLKLVGLMVATLSEFRPAPRGWVSSYDRDPLTIIYSIDLRRSIDHQLTAIRRHLLTQKKIKANELAEIKRSFRAAVVNYPMYLRVLDGQDVGAKPSELAKVLCPNHVEGAVSGGKQINDWTKAANRLRETGYLDLYLLGSQRVKNP